MARTNIPDSASSQFFICSADCGFLDGQYAAFGKVVEGMDIVDAIASCATDASDRPLEEQAMESVRVETFGVDYGEPERIYDGHRPAKAPVRPSVPARHSGRVHPPCRCLCGPAAGKEYIPHGQKNPFEGCERPVPHLGRR